MREIRALRATWRGLERGAAESFGLTGAPVLDPNYAGAPVMGVPTATIYVAIVL